MKVNNKVIVFSLIWLLLFVGIAILVKPASGDTWTNITLPYTITQSGNYRIDQPWTGSGVGLTIDASNVIVDGQNNLLTGDNLNNGVISISPTSSNVLLENINETGGYTGLFAEGAANFTIQYSHLNNNAYLGLDAYNSAHFTVQYSNLNDNGYIGLDAYDATGFIVQYSNMSNNDYYGLKAESANNFIVQNCNLNNNYYFGFATYAANNFVIKSNLFSGNALSSPYAGGPGYGAIVIEDSNCTVTNNIIESNYDGLLWGVFKGTINSLEVCHNNIFENNTYTFHFDYELPSTYTNQRFLFYNNLVNDSAYVDPDSFSASNSGPHMPFNMVVLNLNTTLQAGTRIYSIGSMIGGNFWDNNSSAGFSQTGTDENHDGFVDTPFDLFQGTAYSGTIYDYLPYSTGDSARLVYTAGASQSLAAGQISSVIDVQPQDSFGVITSGFTLNLESTSNAGKFYSNQIGTNQVSSVTIPNGSGTVSFYYEDTVASSPTITVSSQGVTSATTNFTITPAAVASVTITPEALSVTAGDTINYIATASDQYSNTWDVTSSTTWSISSGAAGSWSNNVYTSANAGTWIVTGSYDSTPYTTTLTVNPGVLDHFTIEVPASATIGDPFSITITAKDAFENTIISYAGSVSLSASQGSINPSASGSFTDGVWTGSVTLSSPSTSLTITASDESGHTGTSSAMIVNSPTPSPSPSPTPSPTATPTPSPTSTPIPTPTSTPTPTPTPSPVATPTATFTPIPTQTPRPTATPIHTPTPTPTLSPSPTRITTPNKINSGIQNLTSATILIVILIIVAPTIIALIMYRHRHTYNNQETHTSGG